MANQEKPIRVIHPEFGYVEFHGLSNRQKDVLKVYEELAGKNVGILQYSLDQLNEQKDERPSKRGLRLLPGKGL